MERHSPVSDRYASSKREGEREAGVDKLFERGNTLKNYNLIASLVAGVLLVALIWGVLQFYH